MMPTGMHYPPTTSPREPSPLQGLSSEHGIGSNDQTEISCYRWLYSQAHEDLDKLKGQAKKRKTASRTQLGRGIRKLVTLFDDISTIVHQHDLYCQLSEGVIYEEDEEFANLENDEIDAKKRDWERSHIAVKQLLHFVPKLSLSFYSRARVDIGLPADENIPVPAPHRKVSKKKPLRKSVAAIHGMIKVTPRAIAYACVQLHFALSDAPFWTEEHTRIDYRELYSFIVDYLEVPEGEEAKVCVKKLLAWWNKQIFPEAVNHTKSAANTSRTLLKSQQAIREDRAGRNM